MDTFQKEFVMSLFMDNDSVSTLNKLVIAVANVINKNNDNLNKFDEALEEEFVDASQRSPAYGGIISTPQRNRYYYEREVRNYSDEVYEATFRIKRCTTQVLIEFLKGYVPPGTIELDKKIHVFLRFLTSDLSFNEIGQLFSLHKSTVSHIFYEIGSILAENRYTYISWPSTEEQHLTRLKVNNRYKFPNCVGFIDVCRLKVGLRKKKQETILLQAVCDESLMFLNVHIGEMGKTKKNKVFKDSSLSRELENFLELDNHILGDSEYKLRMNLITPFSSEEVLTSEEMKFNEVHWKTRAYIGHAFELLKEKFRKLNNIEIFKPESVNILIYSACVLHNFILMHEGSSEVKDEPIICDDGVTLNTDIVLTPSEKRLFLCNYINYIDSDTDTLASR